MSLKKDFSSIVLISLVPFFANAEIPKRIQGFFLDKGEVHRIYNSPGRSTLIQLPCNVMTVSKGPTSDFDAQINDKDSRLVEIWAQRATPEPAGLKVLCKDDYYFFDITFSDKSHQDFIDVKSSVGFVPAKANEVENRQRLVRSSDSSQVGSASILKLKLISSSEVAK